MNWYDIKGWFDFGDVYSEQVRRAKPGAHFVEVGAWLGASTAFMGQAIQESGKVIRFDAVDTWKGGEVCPENTAMCKEYAASHDVKAEFLANMKACGVDHLINPVECDSAEAANRYPDKSLDFVFIDADHREESVVRDLQAWWPKVKPGGLLAGHDFDEYGPSKGARAFANSVGMAIYGDGPYAKNGHRCFGIPKPSEEEVFIYVARPNYDGNANEMGSMVVYVKPFSGNGKIYVEPNPSSNLGKNFNTLWCSALNKPYVTHFAMVHADIIPMDYWLNVLMHEMNATGASMVSANSPIKYHYGVTSTGIVNPDSSWAPLRRFTLQELHKMPATFDAADAGYPGHRLALNTGCWLADLRDQRWRQEDQHGCLECYFTFTDKIQRMTDGNYMAFGNSEDWFFSDKAQSLGIPVVATRKVHLKHIGSAEFPSEGPWGTWEHDEATRATWGKPCGSVVC
jgi:hypothetical protein